MSMIIFCQSNNDLKRYGLRSAYDVGMVYAREIVKKLGFTDNTWSNNTFCIMYDDSLNAIQQNQHFTDTSIFYFLNEIMGGCEKISIFHCEPLSNKADWKFFNEKEAFLAAVEKALQDKVPYAFHYAITFVYEKKY